MKGNFTYKSIADYAFRNVCTSKRLYKHDSFLMLGVCVNTYRTYIKVVKITCTKPPNPKGCRAYARILHAERSRVRSCRAVWSLQTWVARSMFLKVRSHPSSVSSRRLTMFQMQLRGRRSNGNARKRWTSTHHWARSSTSSPLDCADGSRSLAVHGKFFYGFMQNFVPVENHVEHQRYLRFEVIVYPLSVG